MSGETAKKVTILEVERIDTIAISGIELECQEGSAIVRAKLAGKWIDVLAAGMFGDFYMRTDAAAIRKVSEGIET